MVTVKKLVEDAWRTYLKVSGVKYKVSFIFSIDKVDKLHHLENRTYKRFKRRLSNWEMALMGGGDTEGAIKIDRRITNRRQGLPVQQTEERRRGLGRRNTDLV